MLLLHTSLRKRKNNPSWVRLLDYNRGKHIGLLSPRGTGIGNFTSYRAGWRSGLRKWSEIERQQSPFPSFGTTWARLLRMPGHTCWGTANAVTTAWGSRSRDCCVCCPDCSDNRHKIGKCPLCLAPAREHNFGSGGGFVWDGRPSYSPPFVADADLELLIFLPSAGITYTAMPSDIWILC